MVVRRNLSIKEGYNYTNASEYVSKNLNYLEEATVDSVLPGMMSRRRYTGITEHQAVLQKARASLI
jgi:hypothetical protein